MEQRKGPHVAVNIALGLCLKLRPGAPYLATWVVQEAQQCFLKLLIVLARSHEAFGSLVIDTYSSSLIIHSQVFSGPNIASFWAHSPGLGSVAPFGSTFRPTVDPWAFSPACMEIFASDCSLCSWGQPLEPSLFSSGFALVPGACCSHQAQCGLSFLPKLQFASAFWFPSFSCTCLL